MRKPESPCLDCINRTANCHSDCLLYNEYKTELDIYNYKIRKSKKNQSLTQGIRKLYYK